MKFTCDKISILKEISVAHEIISSKNALSILSNVLLQAENNQLMIKATDLKVSFETLIPVDVSAAGSTTVYCDKFLSILRTLPDGEIEFELVESRLIIKPLFKKIDFQLKSIASEKFPEIQSIDSDSYFEIPQKDIINMITQTSFAVSDDETRFFMNGVFLEKDGSALSMVATDGRRLSYINNEFEKSISDFNGIIIPPKALNLFGKLASGEGSFLLGVTEKNIFFKFDETKLSSNLIEGQFPNYRRVIPDEQTYTLNVSVADLMDGLKRVSLLVEQRSRRIYLNLSTDLITLTSEESDIGIAKEEISCTYSGPEMNIAVNYMYLMDPLKVIDSEEIQLRFTEPNKAVTIYPVPEGQYFHVIMPMQLE